MIKNNRIRPLLRILEVIGLLAVLNLPVVTALALNIPEPTDIFYVADYAGVLKQDTIDYIVSKNDALYDQTGAQIVIATVDFIDGADIEDYAYEMASKWAVGSAEKNNGVLLLLVIGEDNYWAVQGKGLESHLSSSTLGQLLYDYLEEDFAAGNYNDGVRKVFDAIYSRLERIYGRVNDSTGQYQDQPDYNNPGYEYSYDPSPSAAVSGSFGLWGFIIIIVVLVVVISVVTTPIRRYRRGYYRRTYMPSWPGSFWIWGTHRRHRPPPPPPGPRPGPWPGPGPGAPPNPGHGSGFGGGGIFRGGGAGRSSSGGGGFGGSRSSSFKSGGGFRSGGGGFRSGGGGSFRGGGAGRRK